MNKDQSRPSVVSLEHQSALRAETLMPQTELSASRPATPLSEWSDGELNMRIAELCGWTPVRQTGPYSGLVKLVGRPPEGFDTGWREWSGVLDYTTDLNAMHEAEKVLIDKCRYTYFVEALSAAMNLPSSSILLIYATARKRAEAFVVTALRVPTLQPVATAKPKARLIP